MTLQTSKGPQGSQLRVTVIGGGVIGAATAFYLTEAGASVTLVDAGAIGGGTSSRCDGNVLAIDKNPGYDGQLALRSQALLSRLSEVLGDMEYRSPGSYLVCDTKEEVGPAEDWVRQQSAVGLPFRFLERSEIHAALPDLADDIPAGLYCASDATLNPLLYVQKLCAWSAEHGARVLPYTPVAGIQVSGGRTTGVELQNGETVPADAVVVASGIWTPALLGTVGVDAPIRPRKGHLLVSAKGPRFGDIKVMEFGYLMSKFGLERRVNSDIEKYGVALVYEPTTSGNFLLGSSRQFVGEDIETDLDVVRAIAARAARFYPGMKDATIIRAYAGLRPWTPDHMPIVSTVPDVDRLYVAAGHEGDGIGLAAVTGTLVRDLVLEHDTDLDLGPLSLARFATSHNDGI